MDDLDNIGRRSDDTSAAQYTVKLVLLGDCGVGKSNLILRFTRNQYHANSQHTVGFEFGSRNVKVREGCVVAAQVWDTAGQERFTSLTKIYFNGAVGALIVYDITNRKSFTEGVARWIEQIRDHAHENIVLLLVGNKCDLGDNNNSRVVSYAEGQDMATKFGMGFTETSALDSTNVLHAFKTVVIEVAKVLPPKSGTPVLPEGWRMVSSRTRMGEYSYENQYTKERVAFFPTKPAERGRFAVTEAWENKAEQLNLTIKREDLASSPRNRKLKCCTLL